MVPYQRYLREKKESQEQQELEEAVPASIKAARKAAVQRQSAIRQVRDLPVGDPRRAELGKQIKDLSAQTNIDKTSAASMQPKKSKFGSSTTIEPKKSDTAFDKSSGIYSKASSPEAASPESVSGETVSEIIASAGGNRAAASSVITAVKAALSRSGLELKDTSFLV